MSGDDGFYAALREALRRSASTATDACPDEETLAALVDGALGRSERRRLDEHFAHCGRCRETLVHLRDAIGAAEDERPASAFRAWRPMIAALATASIGVVLAIRFFPDADVPVDRSLRDEVRQGAAEPDHVPPPSHVGRADAGTPTGAGAKSEGRFAEPSVEREPDARSTAARPARPAPEPRTAPVPSSEKSEPRPSLDAKPSPEEAPAPAAPAARALSDRVARAPDSDRTAATAMHEEAPAEADAARASTAMRSRLEASPASQPALWRVTPEGGIERRSPVEGWRAVELEDAPRLTAVDGASESVAWAVAERGLVLRTTNGEDWSRVTAPTDEDLVAVTATDAERAFVTTRTGTRFATDDGGRTWAQAGT